MEDREWLLMLERLQELRHLVRTLVPRDQGQGLTTGERELLLLIYLQPEAASPQELCRASGMKKEAVSRSLRALAEKGCIQKEILPRDERSYRAVLSEQGWEALRSQYETLLRPIYHLRRELGEEAFEALFSLIRKANRSAEAKEKGE